MNLRQIVSDYRLKLMIAIVFTAFLMLFAFSLNRTEVFKELMFERDLKRLDSIGKLAAREIDEYIRGESVEDIREILDIVDNQTEIEFISVLSPDGVVRFSTYRKIEGEINPTRDTEDFWEKEKDIFIKSYPVEIDEVTAGEIQIGYDMRPTKDSIRISRMRALIFNFITVIILFFVGWALSGFLLRPLRNVTAASKRIARGDFSVRLPVKSQDIIGNLAMSMNNMAEQLEGLTGSMEKKVREATRNLNKTNKMLQSQKEELKKKNEKLKEMDKMKSDFVSLVSHELKTPLTSIVGYAKTLLIRDEPEEKKKKYLNVIVSEGSRLASLVDRFLDISMIDSGEFEIVTHEFKLKEFMEETVRFYRKNSSTEIRMEIEENIKVRWDMNAMKQAVGNLIDNALRFTPVDKGVDIKVTIPGDNVNIKIKDYGPGIDEKEFGRIFQKFYRKKNKANAKNKGSGLGLAIVKSIVEMHNGKVSIKSSPGEGAEFTMELPQKSIENKTRDKI